MVAPAAHTPRRGRRGGLATGAVVAAGAVLLATRAACFVLGTHTTAGRAPAVHMRGTAADTLEKLQKERLMVAEKIADANKEAAALQRKLAEYRAQHQELAMEKLPTAKTEALKELGKELLSLAQSGAPEEEIAALATSMESPDLYSSKQLEGTWSKVYGAEDGDDMGAQTFAGSELTAKAQKGGFEGDVTLTATYTAAGKKTLEVSYIDKKTTGLFGMGGSATDLSGQSSVRMLLFGNDGLRVEWVTKPSASGAKALYVYSKTA